MSDVEGMYRELVQLRRGLGLHAPDVLRRVGPQLRFACGIGSDSETGEARQRLTRRVTSALTVLSPELRLAVQAAYGLPPASQSRFLRARMEWLGHKLERDPRTATRRVEAGLRLLAETLVAEGGAEPANGGNQYAPDGWYIESLSSTLLLAADPVQLVETRRIVATRSGLDRFSVSWSVPTTAEPIDARAELHVELLFGGELVRDDALSTPSYWSGWIRLPRSLAAGEQHEYQATVTGAGRRQLRSYYVLSPHRRCDEFELRAKFDPGVPPRRVWQLDGVPFRVIDEARPRGQEVAPDAVGEVVSRFRHLRQGLSYGLQWQDTAVAS